MLFGAQIVRHGGCLGLGLAAMGTENEGTSVKLLSEIKIINAKKSL